MLVRCKAGETNLHTSPTFDIHPKILQHFQGEFYLLSGDFHEILLKTQSKVHASTNKTTIPMKDMSKLV